MVAQIMINEPVDRTKGILGREWFPVILQSRFIRSFRCRIIVTNDRAWLRRVDFNDEDVYWRQRPIP